MNEWKDYKYKVQDKRPCVRSFLCALKDLKTFNKLALLVTDPPRGNSIPLQVHPFSNPPLNSPKRTGLKPDNLTSHLSYIKVENTKKITFYAKIT